MTPTITIPSPRRAGAAAIVTAAVCVLMLFVSQTAWAATTSTGSYNGELTVKYHTGGASPATFTDGAGGVDYIDASAAGTVLVDGEDFLGTEGGCCWAGGTGIYIVYGPKESDYRTNSGWYYSAQWVTRPQLAGASPVGSFDDRVIAIAPSYTADPYHDDEGMTVNCAYNWDWPEDPENDGKSKCYIQTFAAHGVIPTPTDQDEVLIEVHW